MKTIESLVSSSNSSNSSDFSWNKNSDFGRLLSQLPVNNIYEGIHAEVLAIIEEGLIVSKTLLLRRLSSEQRIFINRCSK